MLRKSAALAAAGALCAAVLAKGPSSLERHLKAFLPTSKDLPGWSYVKGTYIFCPTPKSLTKIYDGGYEAYTKRGATAAVSAIYQRKAPKGIMTVIVHYTEGSRQSKALYTWLKGRVGEVKPKPVSVNKKAFGCVLPVPGGYAGYGFYGRIMVSINATGERTEGAVYKALKAILYKAVPKRKRARR